MSPVTKQRAVNRLNKISPSGKRGSVVKTDFPEGAGRVWKGPEECIG